MDHDHVEFGDQLENCLSRVLYFQASSANVMVFVEVREGKKIEGKHVKIHATQLGASIALITDLGCKTRHFEALSCSSSTQFEGLAFSMFLNNSAHKSPHVREGRALHVLHLLDACIQL